MKNDKKYLPGIIAVAAVWMALAVFSWLKPANAESDSERRKLAQFPKITVSSILSTDFMGDFEDYTLDQFPLRDKFRSLKAVSAFYLFGQKDNNDIYIADGYAAKLEYPLNENSVASAGDKLCALYEKYLAGKDMNIVLSIVPDKGYFLADDNGYPAMDYDKLVAIMREKMTFAEYVDITGDLELTDYYKTDTHWKQENITDVATTIGNALGIGGSLSVEYETVETDVPFYGVYYGQAALPMKSEEISYLTNDVLASCTVYNLETGKSIGIYDMDKLHSRDPYEMYLSGAAPLLVIENPKAETDRELIVFRDSFGSSLVPLLVEGYAKVTVVDTRYIATDLVGNYVEFDDQDVLFLYSTLILNSSSVLK